MRKPTTIKILSMILAAAVCITSVPLSANAESVLTENVMYAEETGAYADELSAEDEELLTDAGDADVFSDDLGIDGDTDEAGDTVLIDETDIAEGDGNAESDDVTEGDNAVDDDGITQETDVMPYDEAGSIDKLDSVCIEDDPLDEDTNIQITALTANSNLTAISVTASVPYDSVGNSMVYLTAEDDTNRYYIAKTVQESASISFNNIPVRLKPGVYRLRVVKICSKETTTSVSSSGLYGMRIHVTGKPEITKIEPKTGSASGAVYVSTPAEIDVISKVVITDSNGNDEESWFDIDGDESRITKDFDSGNYSLRYMGKGIISDHLYLSSDSMSFYVPKEVNLTSIEPHFSNGTQTVTLYYIGANEQISTSFDDPEYRDKRLTYKSNNTKVATVDRSGKVKAAGKGTARITVTSVADPSISATLDVTVDPLKLNKFEFEHSKITKDLNPKVPTDAFDLDLNFDKEFSDADAPVTFTVSGDGGLMVRMAPTGYGPYGMSYTAMIYPNTTKVGIRLKAVAGGVYTVTATSSITKPVTCTVIINGYTEQLKTIGPDKYWQSPTANSRFYLDGKKQTGWIGFDRDANKWMTGKSVLKGDPQELLGRDIHYIDPKTGRPIVKGIHKIDGKLYPFAVSGDEAGILEKAYAEDGIHADDAKVTIFNPEKGEPEQVWESKCRTMMTGWIDDVYYSPTTGYPVSKNWVPYKSGRTWVNHQGIRKDAYGNSLDTDGFYELPDGGNYYFKNGMVHTGWLYLDSNGNFSTAKAAGDRGRIYLDPGMNGKCRTEAFVLKGKTYRPITDGVIPLPAVCNSNAKYVYVSGGSKNWINDSNGAVVKNKLVLAADATVSDTDPGYGQVHTMCANADGYIVRNSNYKIKGKCYSLDLDGFLKEKQSVLTEYYVFSGGNKLPVYENVDENGIVSYKADNRTVKNAVLYRETDVPSFVADGSGIIASGTVIKAKKDLKAKKTFSYLVEKNDGNIVHPELGDVPTAPDNGEPVYAIVEYDGRHYAINKDGELATGTPVIVKTYKNTDGKWVAENYAYATKNGTLACDKMVNIKNVGRVMFTSDGIDLKGFGMIECAGKVYWGDYAPKYGTYKGYKFQTFPKRKSGEYGMMFGYKFPLNKDGTIRLGWITNQNDGSRMYWVKTVSSVTYLKSGTRIDLTPMLWNIDGKMYLFDQEGNQITGWVSIPRGEINEVKKAKWYNYSREGMDKTDLIYYFDPKTGAAVTGWKKVPLPVYAEGGFALGYESLNASNSYMIESYETKGKLYFGSDGNLVRNCCVTISGKLYRFEEDGTAFTADGWSDDQKEYVGSKGQMLTGRQKVGKIYYYFEKADGRTAFCQLRKTGKKWYYYDDNGRQATPGMGGSGRAYDGSRIYDTGFMSTTGEDLTAVWNKDGSLKKIVYTQNGKPAAGASVVFGIWSDDPILCETYLAEGRNGYVLDSKGLPVTGIVSGFTLNGSRYSTYRDKDGAPVTGSDSGNSLVKYGKKYYVMDGGLVLTGHEGACDISDWSMLPASDRKVMEFYKEYTDAKGWDLYSLIRDDGSVVSGTSVYADLDSGRKGIWHTDRLGIPMDRYYPLYKVGKKWYVAGEFLQKKEFEYADHKFADIRIRTDGELIGFYDRTSGKPVTCGVWDPTEMLRLKKGKPVTGSFRYQGTYYLIPEIGIYLRSGI